MASKKKNKKEEKSATREHIMSKMFEKNKKYINKKLEKFTLNVSIDAAFPHLRDLFSVEEFSNVQNMFSYDELNDLSYLNRLMSEKFLKSLNKEKKSIEKKYRKFFKNKILNEIKLLMISPENEKAISNRVNKFTGEFNGKQ